MSCRHLVVVFGDQLNADSAAFDDFDASRDVILQMEVMEEASYIPQHKLRLAFFFSAMRHFRESQLAVGRRVVYSALDDPDNRQSFAAELQRRAQELHPQKVIAVEPGDWRVRRNLEALDLPLEWRPDRHFLCSLESFDEFAESQPHLLLESFYHLMRTRLNVLLEPDGSPRGGAWNFDAQNRASLGRRPPPIPHPVSHRTDEISREVLALVQRQLPDSPGRCDRFNLPVSREQALAALRDFVRHRLPAFGRYQDAMRSGEPFLFHSHLSGALNLHLLNPREVLQAVLDNSAGAPLNSVEGFVRQLIGWREFVRGVYWRFMPDYAHANALHAELPVPKLFWTGETDMQCLAEAIGHTIDHAYAHHIERLMVLGLFSLLAGIRPYDVHRWHLSMFLDAIDWVSLPNVIGMSQYADGGKMSTKPYAASGRYIQKMSNYCQQCRYVPGKAVGEDACPFTTLYWDFLARHERLLAGNARMKFPYQNLHAKPAAEVVGIRRQADKLRSALGSHAFFRPLY